MSCRVLVVDDDVLCRESTARALSVQGFDVRETGSFDEALQASYEWLPQAAVIDWNLGQALDGVDLAVALRRLAPDVALVLTTGGDLCRLRQRIAVRDVAPCQLLAKPFTLDDLLATLGAGSPASGFKLQACPGFATPI